MKVEFSYYHSFNNIEKEIIEVPDDFTEEQINEEYQTWLFDSVGIGDNCSWEIIK